ncbi:MAG: 16S rRNA (cytosine(1402)-N(4))-methyltransferase RsmH [Clostridiaceae bacterium]|nr:16S rRNA (cytosine(1402)-N(4))-methyltransferase RsmH [Clostridiaceae bacterium]
MLKDSDFGHRPVLLQEVLDCLNIRPTGIYVDCTLGGAGHASAILSRLQAGGRLIGLDQDEDALEAGGKQLAAVDTGASWSVHRANFSELAATLASLGITAVDGILADLGVSSWQLDQAERGFSYGKDGPLDMRMDTRSPITAATLVNTCSEEELTRILRDFGEERYAFRISRAIVAARNRKPLETTGELADLVRGAMPAAARQEAQHPAKRTFQALRIAVNQELAVLETLLQKAPDLLADGGRLCVITFHSLEDRLVKDHFKILEKPCQCPRDFPVCVCGLRSAGRIITRHPLTATPEETAGNPRSRSAKLRCFERRLEAGSGTTGGADHE